jgi:hypothetical protein
MIMKIIILLDVFSCNVDNNVSEESAVFVFRTEVMFSVRSVPICYKQYKSRV